jgi:hypothetical protein
MLEKIIDSISEQYRTALLTISSVIPILLPKQTNFMQAGHWEGSFRPRVRR